VPDGAWEKIMGVAENEDVSELFLQTFIMLNKAGGL